MSLDRDAHTGWIPCVEIRMMNLQAMGCQRLSPSHHILIERCVIKFSLMSQGDIGTSYVSQKT